MTMTTIPISDVVPLAQWIQAYHSFRAKLDMTLYLTGLSLLDLHRDRFGPETSPGAWEAPSYMVFVEERILSFEIPEDSTTETALEAFRVYQEGLFQT